MARSYYDTLQVAPDAEQEVIEAAYRRLALKYHPDQNPSPQAAEKMLALNEAYEVIGDAARRAEYDAFGYWRPLPGGRKAPTSAPEFGQQEHRSRSGPIWLAVIGIALLLGVSFPLLLALGPGGFLSGQGSKGTAPTRIAGAPATETSVPAGLGAGTPSGPTVTLLPPAQATLPLFPSATQAIPTVTAPAPTVPSPTVPQASPTIVPPTRAPTLVPTAIPTLALNPACRDPQAQINSPAPESSVSGTVQVIGTANRPDFSYYKVQFRAAGDSNWGQLVQRNKPVVNGVLMDWVTATVPPGRYWLRLIVADPSGNYLDPCEVRLNVVR